MVAFTTVSDGPPDDVVSGKMKNDSFIMLHTLRRKITLISRYKISWENQTMEKSRTRWVPPSGLYNSNVQPDYGLQDVASFSWQNYLVGMSIYIESYALFTLARSLGTGASLAQIKKNFLEPGFEGELGNDVVSCTANNRTQGHECRGWHVSFEQHWPFSRRKRVWDCKNAWPGCTSEKDNRGMMLVRIIPTGQNIFPFL